MTPLISALSHGDLYSQSNLKCWCQVQGKQLKEWVKLELRGVFLTFHVSKQCNIQHR